VDQLQGTQITEKLLNLILTLYHPQTTMVASEEATKMKEMVSTRTQFKIDNRQTHMSQPADHQTCQEDRLIQIRSHLVEERHNNIIQITMIHHKWMIWMLSEARKPE
jgi:hypothetical protein